MEQRKVVLLVEDNKQDEILTIRALKQHGLRTEIVVCRDGAEALDWMFAKGQFAFREASLVPAFVLLDLKLPKIDGHQVLSAIRQNPKTKRLPVVVLTTSKEESDVGKCYDCGANSYVQKPVNYNDFSAVIKSLGNYWLYTNEPPVLPAV